MKRYLIKIFTLLSAVVVLMSCGSSRKAISTDVTLSDEEQRRYDYYYLEAVRQNELDNYTGAYNLLEHCLAINPKAPSALYEISQYYRYLGRYAEALQALETAVALAPDNYWYAEALVSYYEKLNRNEDVVNMLEQMAQRFPERQDILYELASVYSANGDALKAATTIDRLEKIVGKSEQLTVEKANAYLRCDEKQKALDEIKSLSDEYPLDNRYKVLLGQMYEQVGEEPMAYDIYSNVLGDEPDNAMALMAMLNYYQKNGQKDEYEQMLNDVLTSKNISSDKKHDLLVERVTYIETSKQDSTVAIALFDKAAASQSCGADVLVLYAQYLWQKNMQAESRPVLEKALAIEPDNRIARLMLLQMSVQNDDNELLKSVCEPGIDLLPDVMEFYLYLSIAYNQEKRTDDALDVLNKALGHIDDNTNTEMAADIYSFRGDLLHEKGLNDEAYEAYDTALSYSPDNVGVLNNYAYYLSVEKSDLDKAEEMSYKTIKAEPGNATYLDTYAWILFVKGRYTEALTYIEQALKNLEDESGVIKEHCGDIYYMNGQSDKAMEYWTQALKDGNDSATLKEKIKRKKYIAE